MVIDQIVLERARQCHEPLPFCLLWRKARLGDVWNGDYFRGWHWPLCCLQLLFLPVQLFLSGAVHDPPEIGACGDSGYCLGVLGAGVNSPKWNRSLSHRQPHSVLSEGTHSVDLALLFTVVNHRLLSKVLGDKYSYCSHFADDKIEAQRSVITCLRLHGW